MLRRHHAHYDLRSAKRFAKIVAHGHRLRNRAAGKKFLVHPLFHDRFTDVGFVRPQAYVVSAFASQNNGNSGTPRSRADDGDLAHVCLDPKRFSVPASKPPDVAVVLDDDQHRRRCHQYQRNSVVPVFVESHCDVRECRDRNNRSQRNVT